MSESKHTPGPWQATRFGITDPDTRPVIVCVSDGEDGVIADCRNEYLDDAEQIANARLIAAAPDLLAACEEIETLFERTVAADIRNGNHPISLADRLIDLSGGFLVKRIIDAIKKAKEGES